MKYVYEDDVTTLVYVKFDDYIEHKEEFDDVGKELLATWIINGSMVEGIQGVGTKIATLTSWLDWVLNDYEGRPICLEDEIYHYRQVKELILDLKFYYKDYKEGDSKFTVLKYIPVSFSWIWNHFSTTKIPMDDIFSEEWFNTTVRKAYENKTKEKLESIKNNIVKKG